MRLKQNDFSKRSKFGSFLTIRMGFSEKNRTSFQIAKSGKHAVESVLIVIFLNKVFSALILRVLWQEISKL